MCEPRLRPGKALLAASGAQRNVMMTTWRPWASPQALFDEEGRKHAEQLVNKVGAAEAR